jgi:hypothetical protein
MAIIPAKYWTAEFMFPPTEEWLGTIFDEIELPVRIQRMRSLLDRDDLGKIMEDLYVRGAFLAIEQSCNSEGRLLPRDMRITRLKLAPYGIAAEVEAFARRQREPYLTVVPMLIYWMMRIWRARLTGAPELFTARAAAIESYQRSLIPWAPRLENSLLPGYACGRRLGMVLVSAWTTLMRREHLDAIHWRVQKMVEDADWDEVRYLFREHIEPLGLMHECPERESFGLNIVDVFSGRLESLGAVADKTRIVHPGGQVDREAWDEMTIETWLLDLSAEPIEGSVR